MQRCVSRGRKRSICVALVGAVLLVGPAQASCVIGTNDIKATRNLAFGAIVFGNSGTVTLTPGGARTAAGGAVVLTSTQLPQHASAEFKVCSATNATVSITLPSTATLNRSGGGSMTVDNFTSSGDPGGTISVYSATQATLTVGARLNVAGTALAGTYSGSFPVTITYP